MIYEATDWTFAWALFGAGPGGTLTEGDVHESDYCLNLRFSQSGKLSSFRTNEQRTGAGCAPNFVDLSPIAELFSVVPESIEHMSLALATRPGFVNLQGRCPSEDRRGVLVIGEEFIAFATWQSGQYHKDWYVKLEQLDHATFDCVDACCHVTLSSRSRRFRNSRTFKLKMVEKDDIWSGDTAALKSALSMLRKKVEILQ